MVLLMVVFLSMVRDVVTRRAGLNFYKMYLTFLQHELGPQGVENL